MARFATGDLVTLKQDEQYEMPVVLDLTTMYHDYLPPGIPLLVMDINRFRRLRRSGDELRALAKVMDPSTGRLYATNLKSLTKMFKE